MVWVVMILLVSSLKDSFFGMVWLGCFFIDSLGGYEVLCSYGVMSCFRGLCLSLGRVDNSCTLVSYMNLFVLGW